MFQVVLLMSLLGAPQAPAAAGQVPTRVDATALAREGHYEAALDAFRRIAAANPRDHEARLWIARLHGLMGHPELAEPVYHSVMLEDRNNLEAMLGTGMTLVTLGRADEGIAILERAEAAQPQNPDVLTDLAQAHAIAGHTTRALSYAERAATTAPTESRRQALEDARRARAHRIEVNSFGERYNTATPDAGSVDLRVNYRLREDLRIVGRGQHQRKFAYSEQRGGAGLEWQWRPETSLFGQILVGPSGNVVLPRVDINSQVAHTWQSAQWVAGYRYFNFPSAQLSVVSPGVTWFPNERMSIGVRYYLAVTDFATGAGVQDDHSVGVRGSHQLVPRLWLNAGYAYGTENFDTLSPDRIGDFRAHTASGGLRLDLRSLTSVSGGYEHQWRPDAVQMGRFTVSVMQRF
jgi:YaiO family outer membrane protein